MKKFVQFFSLLFTVSMLLSFNIMAVGNTSNQASPTGMLTGPDGTQYLVSGEIIEYNTVPASQRDGADAECVTYAYTVTMPRATMSSDPEPDPTSSIRIYVTIEWDRKTDGAFVGYKVTHTSATWTYLDDYVIVKSASLYAKQYGPGVGSSPSIVNEEKTFTNARNGTRYSTGFTGYVQVDGLMTIIGTHATLNLSLGTSNWTFETTPLNLP